MENKDCNIVSVKPMDDFEEDLNINFKKIFCIIWSKKKLIMTVFLSVLLFFIALTFIMPKKYQVSADLYVHKANNSNMVDVNPYVLDEANGGVVSMGMDKAMNNELELMKSALVLDKVIQDNHIVYKKGKKKGEYLTAKAFIGKGKTLKIQNTKNTNVITIQYTASKPDFAYNVVSSLIANYIDVHKELNTEKSKSDTKILQAEYSKAKKSLDKTLSQSAGLPSQSLAGMGNLSAISAFSRSAQQALGNLKGQYLAGERSQIAVNEETEKVNQLSQKLEWAKMVEEMSDSSKVLILSEPVLPRNFEYSSPKLLSNIIFGCLFGILISLIVILIIEKFDKNVTYSMLTNCVIYDASKNISDLEWNIMQYRPEQVLILSCENNIKDICENIRKISNCDILSADINDELIDKISNAENIMILSKIAQTPAKQYEILRNIIKTQGKKVVADILI